MQEEIFGPILPVLPFVRFEDALDHINQRDQPLAIYYFGNTNSDNYQRILN